MPATTIGRVTYSDNEPDEAMDIFHSEHASNMLAYSSTQSNMPNIAKTTNCPVVLMIAPATIICQQHDDTLGKMIEKLNIHNEK
uniref:Phosphoenolpyruvate synthase n=1 Tax=Parastrongyloides trichosuri TaxID=131310 RepID=A0A0N4ZEA3_PARTI